MTTSKSVEWVLRVAVFGEFFGHGVLALQGKQAWIGWIGQLLGSDGSTSVTILTVIGAVDIAVAITVLSWRRLPRVILLWAVGWGFWTALLRPIVGESVLDFIERWPNWGAPLALLFLYGWPKTAKEWLK